MLSHTIIIQCHRVKLKLYEIFILITPLN